MATFEFGGALYRTEREMLDATVQTYLSANGASDAAFVETMLSEHSDEVMAALIECQWEVSADHEAIVDAFRRNRKAFPAWVL